MTLMSTTEKTEDTMPPVDIDNLIQMMIANHTPKELALGNLRYEMLRTLTPEKFTSLWAHSTLSGDSFDLILDKLFLGQKLTADLGDGALPTDQKQLNKLIAQHMNTFMDELNWFYKHGLKVRVAPNTKGWIITMTS